jgi:hypothetical protein
MCVLTAAESAGVRIKCAQGARERAARTVMRAEGLSDGEVFQCAKEEPLWGESVCH